MSREALTSVYCRFRYRVPTKVPTVPAALCTSVSVILRASIARSAPMGPRGRHFPRAGGRQRRRTAGATGRRTDSGRPVRPAHKPCSKSPLIRPIGGFDLPDQWQFFQNTGQIRLSTLFSWLRCVPDSNGLLGNSVRQSQDEYGNLPDRFPSKWPPLCRHTSCTPPEPRHRESLNHAARV
jgi:hypothetical protein